MACSRKNGRTCDQTHQSSFSLYEEYFLKVSSKSDDPKSRYIEEGIFWDQIWPNLGIKDGHARERTFDQTHSSFCSYQEHFLKVSSKSDEPNSRYAENSIFWDQIWPNLGLNDGHAQARMGEHVTKLISLHYL